MTLTLTQLQAIKADILADPALAAQPMNSDGAFAIAAAYNLPAAPAFTVWRTSVETSEIMSNGFIWSVVDALTAGKARIWDWMMRNGTINPSRPNVREGLADAFGAGSQMATQIVPYLKRLSSRIEKLLATGTGSDATPATMGYEGPISFHEIEQARAS
jgi:hypothetical protein